MYVCGAVKGNEKYYAHVTLRDKENRENEIVMVLRMKTVNTICFNVKEKKKYSWTCFSP